MDTSGPDLDRLEQKLNRLKREYDLFLAGQRRGEPTSLRDELEKEIISLTKYPFHSTASKFRMRNLAHRFRALETQIRQLADQKRTKKKEEEERTAEVAPLSVLVDHAALEQPSAVARHLRAMQKALGAARPDRQPPSLDSLRQRFFDEARKILARPGVRGVRFILTQGEKGPKIRGEVLSDPSEPGSSS